MPRTPRRSGHSPEPFIARFAAHLREVAVHRRHFVGWMHTAEVDDDTIQELEVVFSELATNAVTASPGPSDDVRVRAQVDGGMLVIEVSNRTHRPDRPPLFPAVDLDDPLRSSGRGLLIASAFVDSVDTDIEHPDRLVMRCCRRLRPSR